MSKFIYVFSKEAAGAMSARGYLLLKEDAESNLYIFANSEDLKFENVAFDFLYSDVLTF